MILLKQLPDPPLEQLRADYVSAVASYRLSYQVLTAEECFARLRCCHGYGTTPPCDFWSPGRGGLGHCEHPERTCRKHKPWLAGNHCPISRWPPITNETRFL